MNCHYPFELPPLPYAYDALEPHLSAEVLTFHHDRHFAAYVNSLNQALANYPAYHSWPLERLIVENCRLPFQIQTAVWNNAGGVYNHTLYFSSMGPAGKSAPGGCLEAAILSVFGSVDRFFARMKECALSQFGSGYAWLVTGGRGCLKIINTANQDTPFPYRLRPILNLDVWEHAYYLQYQNRKGDYIDNFFQILNWDSLEQNYLASLPRGRQRRSPRT